MTGGFYPVLCAVLAVLAAPALVPAVAASPPAAGTAARPLYRHAPTGCMPADPLNGPCTLDRFALVSGSARPPVPGLILFTPPKRDTLARTFDAGFSGWGRSKRMAHCIAQKPPRPPRQYTQDALLQWQQYQWPLYSAKIRGYGEFSPAVPSSLAVYSYCIFH